MPFLFYKPIKVWPEHSRKLNNLSDGKYQEEEEGISSDCTDISKVLNIGVNVGE
jgi:hypothetical protein